MIEKTYNSYVERIKNIGTINGSPVQMPEYVQTQLQYEVIMGSFAYGVSSDMSDIDVYGFCIPPKSVVFPHTTGNYIFGFDRIDSNFQQWQSHHIQTPEKRKTYDFDIYNIVKFFKLCADGNPNMIDSLFVPQRCITYMSQLGNRVREARHLFLSKKCWHTFKGYAYSQMHKMEIKKPKGKRLETVKKYGFDVKFAYHLVRLLNEIEQILLECDLDLERNREQLKDIRRGKWSKEKVLDYFTHKEKSLEALYLTSELPHKPRYNEIRQLLFECLEMHFADKKIRQDTDSIILKNLWKDINGIVLKYDNKIVL